MMENFLKGDIEVALTYGLNMTREHILQATSTGVYSYHFEITGEYPQNRISPIQAMVLTVVW